MRLHFLNYHHNGDIHYSKEFMRDLYNILQPKECYIHQTTAPELIKDLPFITPAKPLLRSDVSNIITPPPVDNKGMSPWNFIDRNGGRPRDSFFYQNGVDGDDWYIVTWLGYAWICPDPIEVRGCSLYTNYNYFRKIYEELGILEHLKPIEHYVPEIDFSVIKREGVDKFCEDYSDNKCILISNGDVWSGQSANFDFAPIIENLSNNFKDVIFILTHRCNIVKPNVFYTEDIIKIQGCDLNEIGYLSTKCDVIVGRGSGPFCFTHIKDNYFDHEQVMISFAHGIEDGFWYLPVNGCHQIFSNDYSENNIYQKIVEGINYEW